MHNAERVYKCPFCDYAGKRSHSLKEHLVVHSNYRPYVCSQCNASFRKKSHLTSHVKLHSQMKDNATPVCPICMEEGFSNLLALHVHLRESHPSEVYSCDVCQYATSKNRANMTMHMLTHGSTTVFKCSDCEFTALHRRIMEEHIAEDHVSESDQLKGKSEVTSRVVQVQDKELSSGRGILLKCSECGFSTAEKQMLHDHVIAKHLLQKSEDGAGDGVAGGSPGAKMRKDVFGSVAVKKTPMPMSVHSAALRELSLLEQSKLSSADDVTRIRAIVEGLPPFKCWQCGYTTSVSFAFITHMIQHVAGDRSTSGKGTRTVADLIAKKEVLTCQDESSENFEVVDTRARKRVVPITPDVQSSSDPGKVVYRFDESNKWYQCLLCGYSTEFQRSIKAHIWKHTGHKDLDYPMFTESSPDVSDVQVQVLQHGDLLLKKNLKIPTTASAAAESEAAAAAVMTLDPPPQSTPQQHEQRLPADKTQQLVEQVQSVVNPPQPQQPVDSRTTRPPLEVDLASLEDEAQRQSVIDASRDNYVILRVRSDQFDAQKGMDEQINDIVARYRFVPDELFIYDKDADENKTEAKADETQIKEEFNTEEDNIGEKSALHNTSSSCNQLRVGTN